MEKCVHFVRHLLEGGLFWSFCYYTFIIIPQWCIYDAISSCRLGSREWFSCTIRDWTVLCSPRTLLPEFLLALHYQPVWGENPAVDRISLPGMLWGYISSLPESRRNNHMREEYVTAHHSEKTTSYRDLSSLASLHD